MPRLLSHGLLWITNSPFLALSLEGRSLADVTVGGGQGPAALPGPLADAARVALQKVHAAGVLHGDVRLDNFLVAAGARSPSLEGAADAGSLAEAGSQSSCEETAPPRVLLADFGLASLAPRGVRLAAACEQEEAELEAQIPSPPPRRR